MNDTATTKPIATLAVTLSADAIEEFALDISGEIEDMLLEKANDLAMAAWIACGLTPFQELEDGPLAVSAMELVQDAYSAILTRATELMRSQGR